MSGDCVFGAAAGCGWNIALTARSAAQVGAGSTLSELQMAGRRSSILLVRCSATQHE